MPPRFAYWTIILDGAPTSFRTRERDEILPLFNQLKAKNASAELKWFSGGKLWESPDQAKEARQLERVRLFRDERRKQEREARGQGREPGTEGPPENDPLAEFRRQHGRPADGSDQKPPTPERSVRSPRPWSPGSEDPGSPKADRRGEGWDPGGEPRREPGTGRARSPENDPLAEFRRQHGRPADGSDQKPPAPERSAGPPREWSPGSSLDSPASRGLARDKADSGSPKADRRGKGWRPGGEHKDPRDKYKLPPGQARKRWKERNLGSKPFGKRPFGERPPGGQPEGERPPGPPRPFGKKPFGQRPFSGKPSGPGGQRSFGGKPSGPGGPRSFGGKPSGPGGPRSFGGKPSGPGGPRSFGGKPSGPGGPRSFGGKPSGPRRPFGEKPPRSGSFDRRPPRGPRRPK